MDKFKVPHKDGKEWTVEELNWILEFNSVMEGVGTPPKLHSLAIGNDGAVYIIDDCSMRHLLDSKDVVIHE